MILLLSDTAILRLNARNPPVSSDPMSDTRLSALALFVLGILADDADRALTLNYFAFFANRFD